MSKRFIIKNINKNGIRQGVLKTNHGDLLTPTFLPDATRAFLKTLNIDDILKTQTKALVVNTFHLYLQPGVKIIKKLGGVHKFMNWSGPLISDSGGFQIFSLIHKNSKMGVIRDEGVKFKSPIDGSEHFFDPEKSIQTQFDLGVDMMVCLDDCPPHSVSSKKLQLSVNRTIAWAKRSKEEYLKQVKKRKLTDKNRPLLLAVIQGGLDINLRQYCASELIKIGFDAYGFGARPVDDDGRLITEVLLKTAESIPEDCPRFALGTGTPQDILLSAKLGWDLFDCVIPTREGRHGRLFFSKNKKYETINILNAKYASSLKKINPQSGIDELKNLSLAYLHHLFRLQETLGYRLASLNNLEFYQKQIKNLF